MIFLNISSADSGSPSHGVELQKSRPNTLQNRPDKLGTRGF